MQINLCLYFIPICAIIECVATSLQGPNLHRFPDYKHIERYRRQAECGTGEFKCNSGQCIDEELLCDRKADCVDGSDEKNCDGRVTPTTKPTPTKPTQKTPSTKPTPTPTPTKKPTGTPPPGGCLIPKHPSNGEYRIVPTDLKPGDYAPMFGAIVTKCKNSYKVNPTVKEIYPLCMGGQWTQPPPSCERACPPIVSTQTTIIKCKYRGIRLKNCDDPVENTTASLACEPLYEVPGISNNPIRVCKDGSWNYPIPQCLPSM